MTDTPRTDAYVDEVFRYCVGEDNKKPMTVIDFCRNLERENAALRAKQDAQPVAWVLIHDNGKILEYRQIAPCDDVQKYMKEHNEAQWTPLYAAPTPSAERVREIAEKHCNQVFSNIQNVIDAINEALVGRSE